MLRYIHNRKDKVKIKICRSHVKIYEYFCHLANEANFFKVKDKNVVAIDYHQIKKGTHLSYPIVVKCIPHLIKLGCLKKIQDGRGREPGGSKYLVDTMFEVVKTKVIKERIYKIKYPIIVLELRKI
jgi:hypothetical protein